MGASGLILALALAHDLRAKWYSHQKLPARTCAGSPRGSVARVVRRRASAMVLEKTISEEEKVMPPITWFWMERANALGVAHGSRWLHEEAVLVDIEIVEREIRAWCALCCYRSLNSLSI